MLLTNLHGLPEAIVSAIKNDPYRGGGDISVTKLIDSPRIRALMKRHSESVVTDVSERVFSLLGQAVHAILERAHDSALVEERLYADVDGWKLSGQFDRLHLEDRVLQDYKVCSTYKAGGDDSWTRQLNVLRWLAHKNGYEVDRLQIVAIFRDWKKSEAERKPDYPKAPIAVIDVPVWSIEDTSKYINDRVVMHRASESDLGNSSCTEDERWYSGTMYALTKDGAKRATKVAATREELGEPAKGFSIIERPGVNRRCESYCEVAPFCEQFRKIKEQEGNTSDDVDF
jgi:hypothetical protein